MQTQPIPARRVRAYSQKATTFSERVFSGSSRQDSWAEMMSASPRQCLKCGKFTEHAVLRKTGKFDRDELFPACIECRDHVENIMSKKPALGSPPQERKCVQCKSPIRCIPLSDNGLSPASPRNFDSRDVITAAHSRHEQCFKCMRYSFCSIECKHAMFVQTAKQGCPFCTKRNATESADQTG